MVLGNCDDFDTGLESRTFLLIDYIDCDGVIFLGNAATTGYRATAKVVHGLVGNSHL